MTPSGTDKLDGLIGNLKEHLMAECSCGAGQGCSFCIWADAIEQLRRERDGLRDVVARQADHNAATNAELSAETLRRQQAEELVAGLTALLRECRDSAVSFCDYGELATKIDAALLKERDHG
jgi:hypothetical protein